MQPSTIVLVATQRGWRGGEEQAWQLALGLRRRGHSVHLIAAAGSALAAKMNDAAFKVSEFPGRTRSLRTVLHCRRILKQLRPDVVHYNDPHALTAAGLASFGLKIPLRVMARRVDFPIKSSMRYRMLCDRVVCVSRAVAGICQNGGLPASRLSVVYDGVDPDRMSGGDPQRGRQSLQVSSDETLLVTVAALSDHKGHRFLLDALPIIIDRYPKVVLALAGEGELEQPLRDQAAGLGLGNHVRFLGFRSDVPDLIRAADLFVMPSRLEGLCSTLIDVMLAGTPIVATTAGGIPEVLVDSQSGPTAWLVPPENPGELAKAVIAALENPQARAQHVHAARERALHNFTADRMVEETIRVYEAGLDRHKS